MSILCTYLGRYLESRSDNSVTAMRACPTNLTSTARTTQSLPKAQSKLLALTELHIREVSNKLLSSVTGAGWSVEDS